MATKGMIKKVGDSISDLAKKDFRGLKVEGQKSGKGEPDDQKK
jgi:hypothetical protein